MTKAAPVLLRFVMGIALVILIGLGIGAIRGCSQTTPSEQWRIAEYAAKVALAEDSLASIRVEFTFDFGTDPGHGPYLQLPYRELVNQDPGHYRDYELEVLAVSSPSGADVTLTEERKDGLHLVRLGSSEHTYLGPQQYVVDYTVRGLVGPAAVDTGLEQFDWNPIGLGWEVPIDQAQVSVLGPVPVVGVACHQGTEFQVGCQAKTASGRGEYAASRVGSGAGMQVIASFPAGTFSGATGATQTTLSFDSIFRVTPLILLVSLVVTLIGVFGVLWYARRHCRDEVYLNVPPGLTPSDGRLDLVTKVTQEVPVAVRFEPPEGVRPSELAILLHPGNPERQLAAILLDLVIRGEVGIESMSSTKWRLVRANGPGSLAEDERILLDGIFAEAGEFDPTQLAAPALQQLLPKTCAALGERVTEQLKWFRKRPDQVHQAATYLGLTLCAGSIVVGLLGGAFTGWGLLGIPVLAIGITLLTQRRQLVRRTAAGSAIAAQARGFELYLRTARAQELRWEEGQDLFSSYLPYAAAFGLTRRWARLFADLESQGEYHFAATWQAVGAGSGLLLEQSLAWFVATVESAVDATTTFGGGGAAGTGGGGGW